MRFAWLVLAATALWVATQVIRYEVVYGPFGMEEPAFWMRDRFTGCVQYFEYNKNIRFSVYTVNHCP